MEELEAEAAKAMVKLMKISKCTVPIVCENTPVQQKETVLEDKKDMSLEDRNFKYLQSLLSGLVAERVFPPVALQMVELSMYYAAYPIVHRSRTHDRGRPIDIRDWGSILTTQCRWKGCPRRFPSWRLRETHEIREHCPGEKYCGLCDKLCATSAGLVKHMATHNFPYYYCEECFVNRDRRLFMYTRRDKLIEHQKGNCALKHNPVVAADIA